MYKLPGQEELLFYMLYTTAAVLSLIASCYLLFRRANAIAPDITSPVRLRRWTAALFASMTLSHLWYLPSVFLSSVDDILLCNSIGALLDCMIVYPLMIVVLLCMLQDRRRPLWPVAVMVSPLVVGIAVCIANQNDTLLPMLRIYILLLGIGLIIYMVREVRRYGHWLRDNYADLEHKEVWKSFLVLAIMMLVLGIYASGVGGMAYEYAVQTLAIVLVCYLLWRVETLSNLSIPLSQDLSVAEPAITEAEDVEDNSLSQTNRENIGTLLQQHCIDTQLYLQHDLNISQLAKTIGVNRLYLTKYFSSQGTNYNAYINDLRIRHFVSLYHEAVASHRSFSAQQLAQESGFYTYRTFSEAFKRKMGHTVSAWIKAASEREQRQARLDSAERKQARPQVKEQNEG
jgi:AraC-like DNA-binding protein